MRPSDYQIVPGKDANIRLMQALECILSLCALGTTCHRLVETKLPRALNSGKVREILFEFDYIGVIVVKESVVSVLKNG